MTEMDIQFVGWNDKKGQPVFTGDTVIDCNGINYSVRTTKVEGNLDFQSFWLLSANGLRNLSSGYVRDMERVC